MSAAHRVRQFARALRPHAAGVDSVARAALTPAQYALFQRLSPGDRRHAVEVYERVRARDDTDVDLLRAALLHDLGKAGVRLRIWQRVAAVLLEAWAAGLLHALARRGPWRRPFGVYLRHPARGARLARLAGSSPRTIALIAAHQRGDLPDPALTLLREADNA